MQDGALAADGGRQSVYVKTGKDDEHRSIGGGYKTRSMIKGMTILNNPECLSRRLGGECGNTVKVKSGDFGEGRQQR